MILRIIIFLVLCKVQLFAQGYSSLSTDSTKVRNKDSHGLLISENLHTEKYGFVDTTGKIIVPHIYDFLHPYKEGLAPAYHKGKYGFLDTTGQVAIPFEYSTVLYFKNGKAIVSKNLIFGVINKKNETVIPFNYNLLGTHDHTMYHFQIKPQQSGLMDANENIIVSPDYKMMVSQNDSLWIAMNDEPDSYLDKQFTIFKNDGSLHLPYIFQQIGRMNDINLIRVKSENKIGFLNRHYKEAIPFEYKENGPILGQYIAVHNGEKWGFVDSINRVVLPFKYDKTKGISPDKCIVTIEGKTNIINQKGDFLLANNFQKIDRVSGSELIVIDSIVYDKNLIKKLNKKVSFSYYPSMEYGFLGFIVNGRKGYLNAQGNTVIPPIYEDGYHFYEGGTTPVKQNGKWGFIDTTHFAITKTEYDSVIHIGSFSKCDFLVIKDKRYGYFSGGKMIFEPTFEKILTNSDHSLIYLSKGKYGIISKDGQHIHEAIYDEITSNLLGFILRIDENYGFMNKSYEIEIPLSYEYLEHMGYYLFAKKNDKYGTISESNVIVEGFKYDLIEMTPFDMIRIFKNGKVGTLGRKGQEVIPPIYDEIRKIDWRNVEVKIGDKTEILNLYNLKAK